MGVSKSGEIKLDQVGVDRHNDNVFLKVTGEDVLLPLRGADGQSIKKLIYGDSSNTTPRHQFIKMFLDLCAVGDLNINITSGANTLIGEDRKSSIVADLDYTNSYSNYHIENVNIHRLLETALINNARFTVDKDLVLKRRKYIGDLNIPHKYFKQSKLAKDIIDSIDFVDIDKITVPKLDTIGLDTDEYDKLTFSAVMATDNSSPLSFMVAMKDKNDSTNLIPIPDDEYLNRALFIRNLKNSGAMQETIDANRNNLDGIEYKTDYYVLNHILDKSNLHIDNLYFEGTSPDNMSNDSTIFWFPVSSFLSIGRKSQEATKIVGVPIDIGFSLALINGIEINYRRLDFENPFARKPDIYHG